MAETHITTAATFAGTPITSLVEANVTKQTEGQTTLRTDASKFVQAVFLDGLHYTVEVTTADNDFASLWDLGQTGALVLTRVRRANGTGSTGLTDTWTMTDAVLVGVSDGVPDNGTATNTLSFVVVAPDGATDPLTVVSA